jgi:hypothetical protein
MSSEDTKALGVGVVGAVVGALAGYTYLKLRGLATGEPQTVQVAIEQPQPPPPAGPTIWDHVVQKHIEKYPTEESIQTRITYLRNFIGEQAELSLLSCGFQHAGKSSYLNGLHCALSGDIYHQGFPFEIETGGDMGTYDLCGPEKQLSLKFYDMPGMTDDNYKAEGLDLNGLTALITDCFTSGNDFSSFHPQCQV